MTRADAHQAPSRTAPWRAAATFALACLPLAALAQTQTATGVPARGSGTVGVSFQFATINERTVPELFGGGTERFGEITLRSAWLEVDYGLTDRLALSAWLPFKSNRYRGDFPHDPRTDLDDPHGEHGAHFLDDGRYHGTWGDWGVGLRWSWRTEPVAITPFVSFHHPVHDYALYTETQAGTGQWRLDVGANAGGRFPGRLRNLTWQAGYAHSFMERTEPRDAPGRRVNHGTLSLELAYLVSPTVALRTNYVHRRTFNGLKFPDEFQLPPRGDQWFLHDQLFQWESGTASVGVDWRLGERHTLSASWGRTVDLEWGHKYRRAFSVGITRSF
jgi:hypothetical protein